MKKRSHSLSRFSRDAKKSVLVIGILLLFISVPSVSAFSFSDVGNFFSDFFGKITGHQVNSAKQGDFNFDGCVNEGDHELFTPHFSANFGDANYDALYDLNSDGKINFDDFVALAQLIAADSGGCTVQEESSSGESAGAQAGSNDSESDASSSTSKPSSEGQPTTSTTPPDLSDFTTRGRSDIPYYSAIFGDINKDTCVSQKDLDVFDENVRNGGHGYSYSDVVSSIHFSTQAIISGPDYRKVIVKNLGKCFSKDMCGEFRDENDKNKCMIILSTKKEIVEEVCLDSDGNWDNIICPTSPALSPICNLVWDSESALNAGNMKYICQGRYQIYFNEIYSKIKAGLIQSGEETESLI